MNNENISLAPPKEYMILREVFMFLGISSEGARLIIQKAPTIRTKYFPVRIRVQTGCKRSAIIHYHIEDVIELLQNKPFVQELSQMVVLKQNASTNMSDGFKETHDPHVMELVHLNI